MPIMVDRCVILVPKVNLVSNIDSRLVQAVSKHRPSVVNYQQEARCGGSKSSGISCAASVHWTERLLRYNCPLMSGKAFGRHYRHTER